ncbi:hypothetical protein SAMN06313486_10169 [Epsilonproteobacteria bacterium SCGC AD-308-P11]|jgi:hypothetical protein|nr:hypothetical protein SAMN06313486_10169 [Epsilonproteobacteria bacterium SCGC AD-308-P11]
MKNMIQKIKEALANCNDVAKYINLEKNYSRLYPMDYKIAMKQLGGVK